ncbi:MAG: CBS domain-containing protein [Vicinamibacteria bacterium]|nr:CBS domain-containing protein [Vicinamibacteria bacterium]
MDGWTVRELMSKDPHTLHEDEPLAQAVELVVVRKMRHIPILNSQKALVGIVTDRDVKRSLPSPFSIAASEEYDRIVNDTPLSRVMTRDPVTIDADMEVEEAAQRILDLRVGGLPVLSQGKLVGVFTERDALRGLLKRLIGSARQAV